MKSRTLSIGSATAFTVILAFLVASRAFPQTGSQILDQPFPYDADRIARPGATILEFLRNGGGLSGGVVLLTDCNGNTPALHWKAKQGSTFRQVLNDLQAANPTYRWDLHGNVLNLVPTAGIPPLLSAKISSFSLQTTDQQTNAETALVTVGDLPEIRQAATALYISKAMYAGGLEAVPDSTLSQPRPKVPLPIYLQLKDVSLQDTLNAVAQAYGHTMWIYDQRACNRQATYKIDESRVQ